MDKKIEQLEKQIEEIKKTIRDLFFVLCCNKHSLYRGKPNRHKKLCSYSRLLSGVTAE